MYINTNGQYKGNKYVYLFGITLCSSFASQVHAQGVPSDLIDLSMDDLFQTEIRSSPASRSEAGGSKKWNVSYNYRRLEFEGYLNGTKKISNDDILWNAPSGEIRTQENFPIVPDVIVQESHAVIASYAISDKTAINVALPFVKQSTDHFSIVPGYSTFNITSQGLGDISVTTSLQLSRSASEIWSASAGLSLPTGSIDEEGDTPRAPGNQQLPYSMQLGSGTYDIPASINYANIAPFMNWGTQLQAKYRIGDNDRNYTLGNRLSISSWVRFNTISWVEPSIKLAYKYWGSIDGADTEILVLPAAPFIYPAAITNPKLFGGRQIDIFLGVKFPLASKDQFISVELNIPIYQDLNGPQSKEVLGFSTSINFIF